MIIESGYGIKKFKFDIKDDCSLIKNLALKYVRDELNDLFSDKLIITDLAENTIIIKYSTSLTEEEIEKLDQRIIKYITILTKLIK